MASANAELRRLMQLKKASSTKGINHPLAKYNNLDQLSCVICTKIIKDDSLWNPHLQSKKHKENVHLIKNKSNANSTPSKPSSKCPSLNSSKILDKHKVSNNKNTGKQLPGDFFDHSWDDSGGVSTSGKSVISNSNSKHTQLKPKSILKNSDNQSTNNSQGEQVKPKGILKNSYASQPLTKLNNESMSSSTNADEYSTNKTVPDTQPLNRKRKADDESSLPADFFDEGVNKVELDPISNQGSSSSEKEPEDVKQTNTTAVTTADATAEGGSTLPEGFFDDPKKDAAARNIEYVDPKEKEWEMFQKAIQEETRVSEMIQEDDDEESEMHKDLTELNKMRSCLSRVDSLKELMREEKHKKLKMMASKDNAGNESEGSEGSDEDINDMFDWRAKMA